ncbi:hypothetical protein D3C75_753960 [compost metagenome]
MGHGVILAQGLLVIAEGHVLIGHIADHDHGHLRLQSDFAQHLSRVVRVLRRPMPHTVVYHQQGIAGHRITWDVQLDIMLPATRLNHRGWIPHLRNHLQAAEYIAWL